MEESRGQNSTPKNKCVPCAGLAKQVNRLRQGAHACGSKAEPLSRRKKREKRGAEAILKEEWTNSVCVKQRKGK